MLSNVKNVASYGFLEWNLQGKSKKLTEVTPNDIIQHLSIKDVKPPALNIPSVPKNGIPFKNVYRQILRVGQFPSQPGPIPILCAAPVLGIDLANVDFIFGGSTLHMLASETIDKNTQYIAHKLNSGPIVVVKQKNYNQNYAGNGFQFERLVTGSEMAGRDSLLRFESVHIKDVCGYKILFVAECDAVHEGACVEIKSALRVGPKVIWQMISSDSKKLVHAQQRQGRIMSIEVDDIDVLISRFKNVLDEHLVIIEKNLASMHTLEGTNKISFEKNIILTPTENDIMPHFFNQ